MDCDEITQVTWRRKLDEIICGGDNFVFSAFMCLEPVQRSENMVRTGGPGSCNNSMSKSFLDMMKLITQRRSVAKNVGCLRRHLFVCGCVCGFVCQYDTL